MSNNNKNRRKPNGVRNMFKTKEIQKKKINFSDNNNMLWNL